MRARPFVKAVGGKTSSLPFLLKHAPARIGTYYEPMAGGGALFWALEAEGRFGHAWLNDANGELMRTYRVVRDDPEGLIFHLRSMRNKKRYFLETRARDPEGMTPLERAARFVYLNKTCFNGLYRVNRSGRFNVPFGGYPNPTICDADNLRACSEALRMVDLTGTYNYERILSAARPGDFAYIDPPYVPASETASFTGFTAGGWNEGDHEQLAHEFCKLAARGVAAMLSNSDTRLARKLYKGMRVVRTRVRRSVSCDGAGRGPVGEILVVANCEAGNHVGLTA